MVKRAGVDVVAAAGRGQALPSPGLKEAPVLELMCSHFVLTLAAKQGPRFNVRRDINGLRRRCTGRHLGVAVPRCCSGCANSSAAAAPATRPGKASRISTAARCSSGTAFGAAPTRRARCSSTSTNTPRTSPRTCSSVLAVTRDWLHGHVLRKQSTLVEKNIDALKLAKLQLNKAERASNT